MPDDVAKIDVDHLRRVLKMLSTITKMKAASDLLNQALAIYLDQRDNVSAIVLAGAAEDILAGVLVRDGRSAEVARTQMIEAARGITRIINPDGTSATEAETAKLVRGMFNWLRHNDRGDDQQVEWDLDYEAETVIYRALQNWDLLGGISPLRAEEFILSQRAHFEQQHRSPENPPEQGTQ